MPDSIIFPSIAFNSAIIKERVKETRFLFEGLEIIFYDGEKDYKEVVHSESGIIEFVECINQNKRAISDVIYFTSSLIEVDVEVAFQ